MEGTIARLPLDERSVVRIWEHGAFDSSIAVEIDARIVYRGVPSDAGGPDYQDAILAHPDGALERGDVELHVLSSDWYRHGHNLDPRYNNVILHVVWRHDSAETTLQNGRRIPVLVLSGGVSHPRDLPLRQSPLLEHPCVSAFRRYETPLLQNAFALAGMARFEDRAAVPSAEIAQTSQDDTAYAGMFEAMGYASNRATFRALAEAVPYRWIMGVPAGRRASVLLDAAGLGPAADPAPLSRLRPNSWRLARIRPGNHPVGRIQAIADILERMSPTISVALCDAVFDAVHSSSVAKSLMPGSSDHGVLGRGRADELAVSVVLPFAAAVDPGSDIPHDLFRRHRSPPHTRWTRTMLDLAARAGHRIRVRHAADHQGVHAQYTLLCRTGGRADCPLCGQAPAR